MDTRLGDDEDHTVKGTIINFGEQTASDIIIVLKWYNDGASFHQEIITIDSLEGRAIKEINFEYIFNGIADDFQYTISWT